MLGIEYPIRADSATPPNGAEVAARYAGRGWTVVKVIPGTRKAAEKWRELEWRDPETVRCIWGDYAVGILTGPSRLVCDDLDIDDEGNPAGEWGLENLADGDWGKIPRTFALETPSGGKQLIWKAPLGREFKTCASQIAPNIDVRGRGGLFVLWDSTQPGRFVTDDRDPVEMPSWLVELHPEPGSRVNGEVRNVDDVQARKWLEEYGDGEPCKLMARTLDKWLGNLNDGSPHDAMTSGVYALIGDCAAGHTGLNSALDELRAAFRKAVRGRKREREWMVDWRNAIATAIAKKSARMSDGDPCAELEELNVTEPGQTGKLIQWLSDVDEELIYWLWLNYLPLGCIVMLDGESGHGKTLTLYDVAARTSRDWPMPDGTRSADGPANVLVLAPEETASSIIKPRLRAAGADMTRIAIPRISGKDLAKLLLPDGARRITNMIREARAVMLIVDPVTSFLAPNINSSNDSSVRLALAPLASELGPTGCCAVMVRHFNKDKGMDAKYRGGGSVAFAAVARVHLASARLPDSYTGDGEYGIARVDTNMTKRSDEVITYSIVDSDIPLDDEGNMVPRVEWHGMARIDANTLTKGEQPRRGPEPVVQDAVSEALEQMFSAQDTWDAEAVAHELKKLDITANKETITKARKGLGIITRPVHRPEGGVAKWVWTTNKGKLRVDKK